MTRATYTNPILDADWPDPDAIRVGDDYWMIASSFNRAPGLPVLHSRNLVDWTHVNNALPANVPAEVYAEPRHGCGVWAPSIRHHAGTFYIVYPDPDFGIYVLTADDPAGTWSVPRLLLPGRGLIDPCPLWDDDGRAYLVHGWAKSRAGVKNRLSVLEVDPTLTAALSAPQVVIDGDALEGYGTLEGPKFYRRDGWYWIFAPAGGVATGWQSVFRARSAFGPYEDRVVLAQGDSCVNGPHQGAWVDTPDGEDWFVHFQDRGVFGRVVHLQPMYWGEDGWPRMGEPVDGTLGRPVLTHPRPTAAPGGAPIHGEPARSDDFAGTTIATRWHWAANPKHGWAQQPSDGTLHLRPVPGPQDIRHHPAVLAQQLPGRPSRWETAVRLADGGSAAGLAVLGHHAACLELSVDGDGTALLTYRRFGTDDASDLPLARWTVDPDGRSGARVLLRGDVDGDGVVRFSWRRERDEWTACPEVFAAAKGRWIGAEIGLYCRHDAPGRPGPGAIFSPVTVTMNDRKV